jgi:hypothetical protein
MSSTKLTLAAFLPFVLCSFPLRADFQYESTARMTGGALLQMMRFVPGAGKMREPQTSAVAFQGNRMIRKGPAETQIIDIDKRTITTVNTAKKTYSVMTFEQMKEALNNAAASMQNAKQPDSPNLSIDANIQSTGQTRKVAGYDAKEQILTMSMNLTDPRTAQSGTMAMKMDMWIAPEVTGYSEVRDFYKRMAKELEWMPGGMALMGRPDIARAVSKMMAQGGAVEGTPVEEIMSMRPVAADGSTAAAPAQPAQSTAPQTPSSAIGGALAGRLGGFGGFGRKKQVSAAQDTSAPAPASQDTSLIEMTMDNSDFSTAPVSPALFEIPAGFREIAPDLARGKNR